MEISEVITDIYVSKKELYVLYLRYWKEMSLESIGSLLGVTGSMVRIIERNSLIKIRRWFISALPAEEREWLKSSLGSYKFSAVEEVF